MGLRVMAHQKNAVEPPVTTVNRAGFVAESEGFQNRQAPMRSQDEEVTFTKRSSIILEPVAPSVDPSWLGVT